MRRTTFAAILCDPVARAHSYYYHFQVNYGCCKDGKTFREYTRSAARGAADKINKGEKVGGIWSIGGRMRGLGCVSGRGVEVVPPMIGRK